MTFRDDDNYNLNDRSGNPLNFDVTSLGWPTPLSGQMSDTHRFASMTITGYKGSGWTSRQANGYYQYGANGTLTRLMNAHDVKLGGDYRIIGPPSCAVPFCLHLSAFTFLPASFLASSFQPSCLPAVNSCLPALLPFCLARRRAIIGA